MTTNLDYKENIIATRQGGFGSSDAEMVEKIGKAGKITSESDNQRIAQMLGMLERQNITTDAMRLGDELENEIFSIVKNIYPNAISNPYYESTEKTELYGFKVFNHIDYEIQTDTELIWIENKATKDDINKTIEKYSAQLKWHEFLLRERAARLGLKPKLMLSHYQTDEYDGTFDVTKFKLLPIDTDKYNNDNILKGLQVIHDYLPTFKYVKQEVLTADNLPPALQVQLAQIATYLEQIENANKKIDDFKAKMCKLMSANNVKTIDNEFFKITYVPESIATTFDKKTFEIEHPELANKYNRQTTRKASIRLTTKQTK